MDPQPAQTARIVEKLQRTLLLILLLHSRVTDLLLTLGGELDESAGREAELLQRSKEVLREAE